MPSLRHGAHANFNLRRYLFPDKPLFEHMILSNRPLVLIRKGTISDLEWLVDIIKSELPKKKDITLDEIKTRCLVGNRIIVAEKDGEPIGGVIALFPELDDAYLWLGAFKEKAIGIGTAATKEILKEAFVRGFSRIAVKTSMDNEVALAVLFKLGFSIIKTEKGVHQLERRLIINMAQNTLPYTPRCVRDAMRKLVGMNCSEYLDIEQSAREMIAVSEQVSPSNIRFAANGSDAIRLIQSLIAGKEVVMQRHTFCIIEECAKVARSVSSIDHRIDNCNGKVVILCNPNNPTGELIERQRIIDIARVAELVVVDESYMHFVGESIAQLVRELPLLVIKTLSKFGSAISQLGIMIGSEHILERLPKISEPNPAGLMIAASLFSEEGVGEIRKIVDDINSQRTLLARKLVDMGYVVLPSSANFILIDEKHGESKELAALGINVKAIEMDGQRYMRITIRSDWENEIFLLALKALA